MGLLDNLWGDVRATASGRDAPATMLLSAIGGEGGSAAGANDLPDLIHRFEQAGLGEIVRSWVDNAQSNKPVTPEQVRSALGEKAINNVAGQTGLDKHTLLSELAAALPQLIDSMTPNGQVPSGPREAGAIASAGSKPAQQPGDAEFDSRVGAKSASRSGSAADRPDRAGPAATAIFGQSEVDRLQAGRAGNRSAGLRWRSCHASISFNTVAAVSSIERRVTSITGQPWRWHNRRAHSSSALTASSSTYSLLPCRITAAFVPEAMRRSRCRRISISAFASRVRPITGTPVGPSPWGSGKLGTSGTLAALMPRLAR